MDVLKILKDRLQGKAPKGARRSPKWKKVRAKHLEENPRCVVCGSKKKLEVHHIIPFSWAPDKELEPDNLLTLCENGKYGLVCHLAVGHLGNYRKINLMCCADAVFWNRRIKG